MKKQILLCLLATLTFSISLKAMEDDEKAAHLPTKSVLIDALQKNKDALLQMMNRPSNRSFIFQDGNHQWEISAPQVYFTQPQDVFKKLDKLRLTYNTLEKNKEWALAQFHPKDGLNQLVFHLNKIP